MLNCGYTHTHTHTHTVEWTRNVSWKSWHHIQGIHLLQFRGGRRRSQNRRLWWHLLKRKNC